MEAYHNTMLQRFDYGTVADPRPRVPLLLTHFDDLDSPRFRIRIVDVDRNPGVVLAACDQLSAIDPDTAPEGGRSMLQLFPKSNADMKGEFWKLVDISGGFQVWYNKDVPHFASRLKSKNPEVLGMIFPAALREILTRQHIWEEINADPSDWTELAQKISGEPFPIPAEGDSLTRQQVEDWIDGVIAMFCQSKGRFFEQILAMEPNDEPTQAK